TSLVLGRLGCDPAHLPTLVDDGMLDGLDPDRIVVDVERAGFFARRRADAPGELGEVVGRMQRGQRLLPVLLEDQIVPVRDDVVDRAPGHAERDTAIHAACTLDLRFVVAQMMDELAPVLDALLLRFARFREPLVLQKSRYFPHDGDGGGYAASFRPFAASSLSARLYSFGKTLTNLAR